jgi:hypothetical protein
MSFDRAKSVEFSAQSSLLDLGLLAAQSGSSVVASDASTIVKSPFFEEVTVPTGSDKETTLKFTPSASGAVAIPYIYRLKSDGTPIAKVPYASTSSANAFSFSGATLSFHTTADAGERYLVIYEYDGDDTNEVVSVTNRADEFPKAGKFIMNVVGADVCDISTSYMGYLILPQAKLTSNFELTFTTEGKHPFTIKAMQEYCSTDKALFQLIVPQGLSAA